jgi:thiaminase (transcriptional activator TenA)
VRVSFSAQLWDGISDIYEAILGHPFLTGLADGTLPEDSFAFYVIQDALYLRDYARALTAVASRAPTASAMRMFAGHAADAVTAELELHGSLLDELGISHEILEHAEPAPTNLAYTSYLLATSWTGTYAEGVGAVLPCYWLYAAVGKRLLASGSPDPRFQRWITTYGGDEYGSVVAEVIAELDRVSDGLSDDERARVRRHFRTTSRYEWMFWQMGWVSESWPVASGLTGEHPIAVTRVRDDFYSFPGTLTPGRELCLR